MVVKFNDAKASVFKSAKNGHTKAKPPIIDINQPGRLRVANLIALLCISHSTLYAGMKSGRYPKPDGRDGSMPFWKTETIKSLLHNGGVV